MALKSTFSTVGFIIAFSSVCFAAPTSKGACDNEAKKFCQDVKPGDGRIINCLKTHSSKLSPECLKKIIPPKGACDDDIKKFCKDLQPGEGRIQKCLKASLSKISPECSKSISTP